MSRFSLLLLALLPLVLPSSAHADVKFGETASEVGTAFYLSNDAVRLEVRVSAGLLVEDRLILPTGHEVATDADFAFDVMFTGWRAPGKLHNGDNPAILTKADFRVVDRGFNGGAGSRGLQFELQGEDNPFFVRLFYELGDDDFFVRRRLEIRDLNSGNHFLRWMWPLHGQVTTPSEVLKAGGFGRPAALLSGDGGAFFGLESPGSTNGLAAAADGSLQLTAGQEFGRKIDNHPIVSEWTVMAATADRQVKHAFLDYLDDLRVTPLAPYLLYNSWYDVRSPEYSDRPEDVMNEANVMRTLEDLQGVAERHPGFHLDAFVLDDGWDVYESDWQLRPEEFPNGLRPIAQALKEQGTQLGIWFGPTGGYSFRRNRVEWMGEQGFERVGDQMCVAGENYHQLLEQRTHELVQKHKVRYFKWDGIQFSCSEPDHGHPVGIYSRRAVLDAVEQLSKGVRRGHPDMYLNITSGTWLSPWWVKTANMIWMQGRDYGYANVPSISQRDAAMTYRDVVLYENYGVHDFWFPLANLMTHGIIKGQFQQLGGDAEPLDKFTNNAVLYFARGVAMWELYVSPDQLSDAEWQAIVQSSSWARDRFDILRNTEMIGGDPGERQVYGYAHFAGDRGILAVRNPAIEAQTLSVEIGPDLGLDEAADGLVLERVYPTRWISPRLYAAGDEVSLPTDGYETAIWEMYPAAAASEPLVADVVFEMIKAKGRKVQLSVLEVGPDAQVLNPEAVRRPSKLKLAPTPARELVTGSAAQSITGGVEIRFTVDKSAQGADLLLLLEPSEPGKDSPKPVVGLEIDGQAVTPSVEERGGSWMWLRAAVAPGEHRAKLIFEEPWNGQVKAWANVSWRPKASKLSLTLKQAPAAARILPPRSGAEGELRKTVQIGEVEH